MKKILFLMLSFMATMAAMAANTITTVTQVTNAVTVSNDVDYVISGAEPFTTTGSVNITNTEHAVVIIKKIRPSVVISKWLNGHVLINGVQAKNGNNCQVKMYASGAIIMPYSSSIKPLTVYSEQDFGGTAVNTFGLEHTGGFMNTLTDAKLNNKIRSFKLKRGYMVTFSTRKEGRGYSRCFIADKEDLEVKNLPAVLDNKISSYRVFQWYDAQKKGVHDTSPEANAALGTTWAFDWGQGNGALLPDVEWTSHHIYEDWPSAAACGSVTQTCHMQTNNEPGNSADDHPQDVATVLANWENLMRTGMRLCSESSHDGSMNHLKAFMDSIDARGWRCDILDLHCYWDSGTFNNLNWYSDNYGKGRPIWISEWVWGASWNNNGAFASGRRSDDATYNGTVPILNVLNSNPRVERYAYWNSEADFTKIWRGGKLTKLGEYYASMETEIGYKKENEFIPRNPRQYSPHDLKAEYHKDTKKVTLTWRDENGEYNQSMVLQMQKAGSTVWTKVMDVEQKEDAANYSVDVDGFDGYKFRIVVVDLLNKERTSNVATAVNDNLEYGDDVTLGEKTMFLGGNMLINGDFSLGTADWTDGQGNTIAAPYFQVIPKGGAEDKGAYLQCYGTSTTATNVQSLRKMLTLEENASYYVEGSGCNTNPTYQRISTTTPAFSTVELSKKLEFSAVSEWAKQGGAFSVTTDNILLIQLRGLAGKAMIDNLKVCKLFDTKEEALADAMKWEKARMDAFKQYCEGYDFIAQDIEARMVDGDANVLKQMIDNGISTLAACKDADRSVVPQAQNVLDLQMDSSGEMAKALNQYKEAKTAEQALDGIAKMKRTASANMPYAYNNDAIKNPSFSSADNWTKCGTYTSGDQRTAEQAGKTCWNAWWNIASAGNEAKTMAVKQQVVGLPHGFYALECKATTQHLCETDQHAFLQKEGEAAVVSPNLSLGLLDVETFSNNEMWETMVTPYIYVNDGDVINVGFTGSKAGAVDKSWARYGQTSTTSFAAGDNREGWWCATDFKLRYIQASTFAADESKWGTFCSAYTGRLIGEAKIYNIKGITEDQGLICLEEADLSEPLVAGKPYVFYSETGSITITESGNKVSTAKTNENGLRGTLSTTAQYPLNSLVLTNGKWEKVTERYPITPYSGYVYKIANIPVLKEPWAGIMLPTSGVVDLLLGDADGDGSVTSKDANMIVNYFLGIPVEGMKVGACDVDGDGKITMSDANAILNLLK